MFPKTFVRSPSFCAIGLALVFGLLVQASAQSLWAKDNYVDLTGNFPDSDLDNDSQLVEINVPAQLVDKRGPNIQACGNLLINHLRIFCANKRKRSSNSQPMNKIGYFGQKAGEYRDSIFRSESKLFLLPIFLVVVIIGLLVFTRDFRRSLAFLILIIVITRNLRKEH
eukprot:maker-scaffold564_size136232-snap-gene-0.34 protein:Tk11647 transcript:maker-scaffold564_size136232-snap-gene-0.34-mRNA-1 annotation:"metal transporter"